MIAMPAPGRFHNRVELGKARRPVQLASSFGRRSEQNRRIAGAARRQRPRYGSTCYPLDGTDDLLDRVRTAGAEIVSGRDISFHDSLERLDMRVGEVGDMDVVPQTGAVRRWVIIAVNFEAWLSAR